jgi:hypothetical protein
MINLLVLAVQLFIAFWAMIAILHVLMIVFESFDKDTSKPTIDGEPQGYNDREY